MNSEALYSLRPSLHDPAPFTPPLSLLHTLPRGKACSLRIVFVAFSSRARIASLFESRSASTGGPR